MTQDVVISLEGTQKFIGDDLQKIEMITEGTMETLSDKVVLRFEESAMTGMEGAVTTLEVLPNQVILTRSGAVQSRMVFEKGKKDVSLYDVGFGALMIGVKARRLKSTLGPEGGRLELSYGIEIENQVSGLNTFNLDVRPKHIQ